MFLFKDIELPSSSAEIGIDKKRSTNCAGCFCCIANGRAEEHHFPLPEILGGRKTITLCVTCHDMVDRFKTQSWGRVFEDVIAQCDRTEHAALRLLIMKMAKVVAWSLESQPHLWEKDGTDLE
jgi:hypothetical protein